MPDEKQKSEEEPDKPMRPAVPVDKGARGNVDREDDERMTETPPPLGS